MTIHERIREYVDCRPEDVVAVANYMRSMCGGSIHDLPVKEFIKAAIKSHHFVLGLRWYLEDPVLLSALNWPAEEVEARVRGLWGTYPPTPYAEPDENTIDAHPADE